MSHPSVSYQAPASAAEDARDVLDLSVIIVNYNVREFLEQALRSVQRACDGIDSEVFVVDNNSVDGSVSMVRSQFPDVRVIANEQNVGFSKANNQAIRRARGRYLLILNPDTIVQEDTLATLVRFMDTHPDAGAVGCKILNPDGTFAPESRRAFPTPTTAFYRLIGLSRLFPHSPTFGRYNLTYLPDDEVTEVDALSGSCMMVRRAALQFSREQASRRNGSLKKPEPERTNLSHPHTPTPPHASSGAGLLDEDFFMYGEDLDWCYRIQQAGWNIYYTPETQIIHYKGESTKKGELRYVRLFYGAMLRFTEKHVENRYSRLFAGLLRLGILARAGLTVLSNTLRRLTVPLIDGVVVVAIVASLGAARSAQTGIDFAPSFYWLVAPGYALSTVAGIALTGGYRRGHRRRLRPVWLGAGLGLLLISAASFFVKDIAFSRVVVLLGFVLSAAILSVGRLAWRARHAGPRRALLVGHAAEAHRLQGMLATHPRPCFNLIGYVAPDDVYDDPSPDLPCLGTLRHLRDLVRLRHIDDVVFAADGLSNRTTFRQIQQLQDLPVQFKILAQGREHVIGKASIDTVSAPSLFEAEDAVGTPRSPLARWAFELPLVLVGLLLHPLIWLGGKLTGHESLLYCLANRTRHLPAVLLGRRALVGYHSTDPFQPPPEWNLKPGLFAITDTLGVSCPSAEETSRAYWFYVSHQSASLDWDILVRAIGRLKRSE